MCTAESKRYFVHALLIAQTLPKILKHMNKIFIISIVLFTTTFFQEVKAQKVDSTALKEINLIKKVTYGMGTELFKTRELQFRTNKDYETPWEELSSRNVESLKAGLNTIIANGTIEIEKNNFSGTSIVFNSKVEGINDLDNILEIELIDSDITDSSGESIAVKKRARTNYGSQSGSGIKNGQSFSYNYRTIKSLFKIETEKDSNEIKGNLKLLASFPSSYDKVLITPEDIGKEFILGDIKYSVINIIKNIIILRPDIGDNNISLDFNFVNLDRDGNEIGQIPYFELIRMNKGKDIEVLGVGKQTITEKVYNIFNENPNITQEEFNEIINPIATQIYNSNDKRLESKKLFGKKYIAITNAGPVEKCYLYFENRETKQEFEKEL